MADRRIVNLPRWLWLPILHGVILHTRPKRSARLYQNIWTEVGSPLLAMVYCQGEELRERLSDPVGAWVEVVRGILGMPHCLTEQLLDAPLLSSAWTLCVFLDILSGFGTEEGHERGSPTAQTVSLILINPNV